MSEQSNIQQRIINAAKEIEAIDNITLVNVDNIAAIITRHVMPMDAETDQLRVQLAGCLTAASGHGQDCYVGDYGWSPAYQSVVELRKLYKKAIDAIEAINAGFIDGSIKFTHKRKSEDEPYHKANTLMTAALAAHRDGVKTDTKG